MPCEKMEDLRERHRDMFCTPNEKDRAHMASNLYFASPGIPCAIVGMGMTRFRALGVPHPP